MSDNIPFELQAEIIKRVVPVKSLIQFRSVSKQWKSLIDSSQFITHHTLNHSQPHHLLINYKEDFKDVYVSMADDDSFPIYKFFLRVPIIVGSGVCPTTCDPKIVTITRVNSLSEVDLKAEVFALSSWDWLNVSMNLRRPLKSVDFSNNQVVIDGAIHWIAYDAITESRYRIISFGLTSEEFGEVDLPDSLSHSGDLSISELKGSLAVLNHHDGMLACEVWMMMKNGDPEPRFTKLFTVDFKRTIYTVYYRIIGFKKNGKPVAEHVCRHAGLSETMLEAYESFSEESSDLGIDAAYNSAFLMTSYTESLLLLNHSDSIVQ